MCEKKHLPVVRRDEPLRAAPDLEAAADALLDDARILGSFLTLDPASGRLCRLELIDAPASREVSVGRERILSRIRHGSPRFRSAVRAAIVRQNTVRVGEFCLDPAAIALFEAASTGTHR